MDAGTYYVDMFTRVYGAASATFIPVTETSGNADDAAIAATVRGHTGVFFGGGDQLRITNTLRPNGRDTLVLQAIRDVLRAGGTVGGTSAGTACQGLAVMVISSKCSCYWFTEHEELFTQKKSSYTPKNPKEIQKI